MKYASCMHIYPNCVGFGSCQLFIYEITTILYVNLFSERVSHFSVAGQ